MGLTTALVVLRSGWVVVGSLPTTNGTPATAMAGCLLILDHNGKVRETVAGHGINGPWDATARDDGSKATVFVSNVLDGTVAAGGKVVHHGTVVRLRLDLAGPMPKLVSERVVASGLAERTDPAALVVGPTGLALDSHGTLYVADSVNSRLAAIPHALARRTSADQGATVRRGGGLNVPLGLAIAPGGDLLTVNAGNGKVLEVSPVTGGVVATRILDRSGSPPGAGALFGLAVKGQAGVYFVDDATNTLRVLHRAGS